MGEIAKLSAADTLLHGRYASIPGTPANTFWIEWQDIYDELEVLPATLLNGSGT